MGQSVAERLSGGNRLFWVVHLPRGKYTIKQKREYSMDVRSLQLNNWLKNTIPHFELQPLKGDASFRRYFRVVVGDTSYVVMDAPPERENCVPFVAIAKTLRSMGLVTPQIYASDLTQGFLLLSDFGNSLFLDVLNEDTMEQLYGKALDSLLLMHTCRRIEGWAIPHFTADFMRQELELFKEWFLIKHINLALSCETGKRLSACFDFLAHSPSRQPQVFMHRDFHSANLMWFNDQTVGILDFQDAFIGPITYDLVSLLRDCYIAWPEKRVRQFVFNYWEELKLKEVSFEEFYRWFDLMGLQRHLKALLTFSRKLHRDGNANYLQHIPRTQNYILTVSERYSECAILSEIFTGMLCAQ